MIGESFDSKAYYKSYWNILGTYWLYSLRKHDAHLKNPEGYTEETQSKFNVQLYRFYKTRSLN